MAALRPQPAAGLLAALLALGLASNTSAAVLRFTQNSAGATRVALGYPVPLPVDSQTPVDGFRSYTALIARLQDLSASSEFLSERSLGNSLRGRSIQAFVASDADALTAEGFPEPAMLQNGGIHAREWASPEVVTGLLERLIANAGDQGLYRYLLEDTQLVAVPVLNVDGFLQTQRHPDQALQTEFAGDPQNENYPRDGRMQRKTMRDKDEILCAADDPGCAVRDGMAGVDANRNNRPFHASSGQSSGNPASLVFHGAAPASEPEILALQAAAALGPAARLRLYTDNHSFSRVYFAANTGNARRDALQGQLASAMRAVNGNRYGYDPTPAGVGIGSTDEYFAYTYQIPAYTLEIEPGANGATEYGGFGYSHDGFVLPANQIARVRNELADAAVLGQYRQAGPPSIRAVEIRERDSGTVVYAASWQRLDDSRRQLQVSTRAPLRNDTDYRLWLAFNKPMRVRSGGSVANFAGQGVALAPRLLIEGLDSSGAAFSQTLATPLAGWRGTAGGAPDGALRYLDDAYSTEFRIPAATALAGARRLNLRVDAADLSGQRLDADPATVIDWSGGAWARWEGSDGSPGDSGGEDRSLRLIDDGSPLFGSAPTGPVTPPPAAGGGGGALPWSGLLLLAVAALRRRRR